MTQQSHSWTYTLRKPDLKETHGMCLHIPCAEVAAMFLAALFIIARTWKQPRCPSADEWILKLWYIYIMECYSAIKKNSFESVLMRWIKLEPIIQSEVSQKDKDQYSILTNIMEFRKMVMITLYAKQKKRHRCTEQTFGLCGRR